MAKTVTIQTKNVDLEIKKKAEKVVKEAGMSSLQDVIRIIIIDIAEGRMPVRMAWGSTAKDPEIRESLEQYMRGEYTTVKPGQKLSDAIKSRNVQN